MLLMILVCTVIGWLVGYPMIGFLMGVLLFALGQWAGRGV